MKLLGLVAILFIPYMVSANKMTINNQQVKNTIIKYQQELNDCYQDYLAQGFDAYGKMILKWNIHPDGKATHVRAVKSIDKYLDKCISKKLRTWVFPKTGNQQIAEVRFPFIFKHRPKKQ